MEVYAIVNAKTNSAELHFCAPDDYTAQRQVMQSLVAQDNSLAVVRAYPEDYELWKLATLPADYTTPVLGVPPKHVKNILSLLRDFLARSKARAKELGIAQNEDDKALESQLNDNANNTEAPSDSAL